MFWMRKVVLVALIINFHVLCNTESRQNVHNFIEGFGANGGTNCAVCTVVTSLIEQLSVVHNETLIQSLERFCGFLPHSFKSQCKEFADVFGKHLIEEFTEADSADTFCQKLGFCTVDKGKQACHLFPKPKHSESLSPHTLRRRSPITNVEEMSKRSSKLQDPKICNLPGIDKICHWLDSIFNNHDPAVDLDGDRHSIYQTLRGSSWRGKDCNDKRRDFHPGARPLNSDLTEDSNCNGIYGVDENTGEAYEDLFCGGTEPRGVAVLGDSISAHFHLPRQWFNATEMSEAAFEPLVFIAENELDWPQFSSTTGFMNNTYSFINPGPVDSIYNRLRNRNRCNHRDYQNIAVNGARSSSMVDSIEKSLFRNQSTDHALLVFYALVGNDVCNGHPDTFKHMTTPEEMRNNSLKTLQYLENTLPKGSHVFITGLADGSVLYKALHDRIHPIGAVRQDVTYSDFYDYFNCLEISPCLGWMNTNETIRNLTTQRAEELTAVLQDVVKTHQKDFTNFQLHFLENPMSKVIFLWEGEGGEVWQLLEPVDGFHSNQLAQAMTTSQVWEYLANYPEIVGSWNYFNNKILEIFGDQGGHI